MPFEINCTNCNKSVMKTRITIAKTQKTNFCSRVCCRQYRDKYCAITKPCSQCGKIVKRVLAEVKKNKTDNIFCNHSCAATYQNKHKTTGTTVSKLERYLQEELPKLYPTINFVFNNKTAINSELDIYLPELNLAFELNGVFHYEPIFGKDKFDKIQNNDRRKFQACLENSIELVIVDSSTFTYFKKNRADKFLNIVKSVIDEKLGSLATIQD